MLQNAIALMTLEIIEQTFRIESGIVHMLRCAMKNS